MADNDNRSVLQVTADKDGKPSLQSLNEVLRALQMNTHKIEGRLGESTVRDDLRVMGRGIFTAQTTQVGELDTAVVYFDEVTGRLKASENGGVMTNVIVPSERAIVISIGDVTSVAITTGVKGYVSIPFAGTITGWTLVADAVGSIVLDIWKDTYANFPPTVADTITGSEKPTLAAVQNNRDLSLSTWVTTVAAGNILGINVDSAATVKQVTLTINFTVS